MCSAKDWIESHCNGHQKQQTSTRSKVQIHRLILRRRYEGRRMRKDMELKNLKLYLENRSILEENEKLRQKAFGLKQENLVLLSEFQKKFKSSQLG